MRERSAAGITQAELADRLGVFANSVARWERGVQCPSAVNLFALADALQVEPGQLRR